MRNKTVKYIFRYLTSDKTYLVGDSYKLLFNYSCWDHFDFSDKNQTVEENIIEDYFKTMDGKYIIVELYFYSSSGDRVVFSIDIDFIKEMRNMKIDKILGNGTN